MYGLNVVIAQPQTFSRDFPEVTVGLTDAIGSSLTLSFHHMRPPPLTAPNTRYVSLGFLSWKDSFGHSKVSIGRSFIHYLHALHVGWVLNSNLSHSQEATTQHSFHFFYIYVHILYSSSSPHYIHTYIQTYRHTVSGGDVCLQPWPPPRSRLPDKPSPAKVKRKRN
mgnify:CR=1 FL=1